MQQENVPKISVVMSVYNAETYLAKAIDSVLNQTFKDFEFLMMDDGSTDKSLEIINQFAEKDSRCRVFTRENKGLIVSRNELVSFAKADIIANMDADDICMPTRLEQQYAFLCAHPECVVVTSPVILIDSDGEKITKYWNHLTHEEIDQGNLAGGGAYMCNPVATMRKLAFEEVGGLRARFQHAEDIDLYLRLAEIGKIGVISEPLLEYRQHLSSIGYTKKEKQFESMLLAVNEARQRRNMPLLEKYITELDDKVSDVYYKWGWWALNDGNLKTARKYGFKLLQANPFNFNYIKFNLCVIRDMLKH
ncbi:MAG: glycosyltransferase family 2 protein [Methylophilus sp.]|nr:glycosyltransferase family 2 protein [Methylophilus sp.]